MSLPLCFSSVRRSELVLFAYFIYATILAQVLPIGREAREVASVLNLTILASYSLLIYAHSLRGRDLLGVLRDWFPLALVLLAYREMGWFAPQTRSFALERRWIILDRLVLRNWHVHDAIEWLGPLVPSVLEISYSLVYFIAPFALGMIYAYGAHKRAERFLLIFVLGVLLAYVQFPFWPSEPPRTVFPGEDAPSIQTVFRRFQLVSAEWLRDSHQRVSKCTCLGCVCRGLRDMARPSRKTMGGTVSICAGGVDRHSDGIWPLSLCCGRTGGLCGERGRVGAGLGGRAVVALLNVVVCPVGQAFPSACSFQLPAQRATGPPAAASCPHSSMRR